MNRFIKKLKSYPTNLTLGELIDKVTLEESAALEVENSRVEAVKKDFKNTYFKSVEDDMFGKSTVILHIEKIITHERTTDWDFVYSIKGTSINFSPSFLFKKRSGVGTSFIKSEDNLRARTKITKEEYQAYLVKYENIVEQINNI